jgi:hypothetical protein
MTSSQRPVRPMSFDVAGRDHPRPGSVSSSVRTCTRKRIGLEQTAAARCCGPARGQRGCPGQAGVAVAALAVSPGAG